MFCENATPEKIRVLSRDDVHARPETRILGTLSNFPEFSTVYNCPPGKGMNPIKKCALFDTLADNLTIINDEL